MTELHDHKGGESHVVMTKLIIRVYDNNYGSHT